MTDQPLKAKVEAAQHLLTAVAAEYAPAALASSLGAEDMVLTDLALRNDLEIEIFVLDTGRLHGDTLDMLGRIERRYGYAVRVMQPDPAAVAEYVQSFGRDALYGSVELRKRCCAIRKTEPLTRALEGKRAWITGLRRAQSADRSAVLIEEWDAANGMPKFNPLAYWSEADVWSYLKENDVPVNPLYEQGYTSIGCAPCSRPVLPGEDPRAGRWWWEIAEARECGLHVAPDGRPVREEAEAQ
ncbi:MAG: phosphoadenylyl-sulfate reductase [Burkholderiales bacterium]